MAAAGVAKFKWPERLEIVAELPVTKMGKLDKKALREMARREEHSMTAPRRTLTARNTRPG